MFMSFLINQAQSVVVNGVKFVKTEVKSGVPQGSVPRLLLFIVLVGDMDQNTASPFVSSVADNT